VHFNGHLDVVQTGAGWTVDPFAGLVKDGKVYGRGACDMKGGLAAAVIAVEALLDSGMKLPGAIEISGTVDEESGGYGGVAYLAERGVTYAVEHIDLIPPTERDAVAQRYERMADWLTLEAVDGDGRIYRLHYPNR